jgi:branched-chain amino acid transport system permease protein
MKERQIRPERLRTIGAAVVILAAAACLPLFVRNAYFQNILVLTFLYAALSQSWNILGGYCGQISLGHAIYFGVGAYASTALLQKYGISPWLGMCVGGLLSAGLAVMLGYPCFRLKGHYYTIATIVIAEIGLLIVGNWDYLGGDMGLEPPLGPDSWRMLAFARSKVPYFCVALALTAITWLVTFLIEDSRWGYWWRAVKDDALAAESLGVDVFRSKIAAAATSAFFTSLCGSLYAAFVGFISPDSVLTFQFSLLMALPAVIGGVGTLWGPLLGAVILIPISEITRSYSGNFAGGLDFIIYGALIVAVSLTRPEGLLSLARSPIYKRAIGRGRRARSWLRRILAQTLKPARAK